MVVEKGDKIYVPASEIGPKEVQVKWKQNLMSREEKYYICNFFNLSRGNEKNSIYIQANKVDHFKGKKTEGDDITIIVDDTFQYGQDNEKKYRWLVFHDKEHRPYQHRFLENTLVKYGDMAANLFTLFGLTQIKTASDIAKWFIGDYLHNF